MSSKLKSTCINQPWWTPTLTKHRQFISYISSNRWCKTKCCLLDSKIINPAKRLSESMFQGERLTLTSRLQNTLTSRHPRFIISHDLHSAPEVEGLALLEPMMMAWKPYMLMSMTSKKSILQIPKFSASLFIAQGVTRHKRLGLSVKKRCQRVAQAVVLLTRVGTLGTQTSHMMSLFNRSSTTSKRQTKTQRRRFKYWTGTL